MDSTIVPGPVTISPPAKIPFTPVSREVEFTCIVPHRVFFLTLRELLRLGLKDLEPPILQPLKNQGEGLQGRSPVLFSIPVPAVVEKDDPSGSTGF
jgi:hypothetical protein